MYLFTYGSEFNFKMIASYSHAIKIWFLKFPLQCLAALDGAKGPIFGKRRAGRAKYQNILTSDVGFAYFRKLRKLVANSPIVRNPKSCLMTRVTLGG